MYREKKYNEDERNKGKNILIQRYNRNSLAPAKSMVSDIVFFASSAVCIGGFIFLAGVVLKSFVNCYPKLGYNIYSSIMHYIDNSPLKYIIGGSTNVKAIADNVLEECDTEFFEKKFSVWREEAVEIICNGTRTRPYSSELMSHQTIIPFKLFGENFYVNLDKCPIINNGCIFSGEGIFSCFLSLIKPGDKLQYKDSYNKIIRCIIPFYIDKEDLNFENEDYNVGELYRSGTGDPINPENKTKSLSIRRDRDKLRLELEQDNLSFEDSEELYAFIKNEGKTSKLKEGKSIYIDPSKKTVITNDTDKICALLVIDYKKDYNSMVLNMLGDYMDNIVTDSSLSATTKRYLNLNLEEIPSDINIGFGVMKEKGLLYNNREINMPKYEPKTNFSINLDINNGDINGLISSIFNPHMNSSLLSNNKIKNDPVRVEEVFEM